MVRPVLGRQAEAMLQSVCPGATGPTVRAVLDGVDAAIGSGSDRGATCSGTACGEGSAGAGSGACRGAGRDVAGAGCSWTAGGICLGSGVSARVEAGADSSIRRIGGATGSVGGSRNKVYSRSTRPLDQR